MFEVLNSAVGKSAIVVTMNQELEGIVNWDRTAGAFYVRIDNERWYVNSLHVVAVRIKE